MANPPAAAQAWTPDANVDYGKNTALNQTLAQTFGYGGDFGGGQWGQWASQNLSPEQQAVARGIINNPAAYDQTQDFGKNQFLNQQLANQFGYTGDFGGGQWSQFKQTLSPEQQALADQMIASGGYGGEGAPNLMQQVMSALQGAGNTFQGLTNFTGDTLAETNLQPYMNPFQQDVIDSGMAEMRRQNEIQQDRLGDMAQQAGAFGGSRHGIAEAEMNRNLAEQQQRWLSNLNMQNFLQGQQGAKFDIGNQYQNALTQMQAAQGLGNTSNLGFGMAQGIGNQVGQAALNEQQAMQNLIDSINAQYGNVMGWPQTQAGMMAGFNPGGGGTSTTTQQPGLMNIIALITALGGLCWVAREVYGPDDVRWQHFRAWLVHKAPRWLTKLYWRHGERFAGVVRKYPVLKRILRPLMDRAIA